MVTLWVPILLAFLQIVMACDLPPEDHEFVQIGYKCRDKFPTSPLCWVDCYAREMGVVDSEGCVHEDKLDEKIAMLEDGDLKEAALFTKSQCFEGGKGSSDPVCNNGMKIEMGKVGCTGFMKVGKCMRTQIKLKCKELATAYGL